MSAGTVGGYRLLARLGEGGMGVVHLAQLEGEPDAPEVALKVLRPHVVGDDEARERLAREVGSLQRVRSPRVAEVLDADPWGDVPFVATRYVPGPTLHDHVRAHGPLGPAALHRAAYCLAEALAAVHAAGVQHRDVKPGNVLLEDGGDPVLIDFGLARLADDVRITRTGWLLGTPGYLAPEVLLGHEAGAATDVHGWAATLVFAATGRPPYGRGPAEAVMDRTRRGEHDLDGVPEPLRSCLDDCLHPDPARRPGLDLLLDWLAVGLPDAPAAGWVPVTAPDGIDDGPAPTAVLPIDDEDGDEHEDDLLGGADPWPPPRPPYAVRVRATGLLLALVALSAAAAAAAPLVATAALVLVAWLLRGGALAAEVRRGHRQRRGPRWWDGPATVLGLPWRLVVALPGTVLLALWSAVAALAGGLAGYAASTTAPVVLAAAGAGAVVGGWWGPGAGRLRRPLVAAARGSARRAGPWVLVLVVLLAGAGALGALAAQGPAWWPLDGPPPGLDRVDARLR